MPLHDHFHPPLSERRPWESFHATWCGKIADHLNEKVLPAGFIALEQAHSGAAVEIDVGTYTEPCDANGTNGATAVIPKTVWTPVAAPRVMPAEYPEQYSVEIYSTEGARTLVAAIELVSPGNKDRESKRLQFAAKCASYLARGAGLVIIDAVTSRRGNLHNDMIEILKRDSSSRMSKDVSIYVIAFRPLKSEERSWIDFWPFELKVGEVLPQIPLSVAAEWCFQVDLEVPYADACRARRIEETVH